MDNITLSNVGVGAGIGAGVYTGYEFLKSLKTAHGRGLYEVYIRGKFSDAAGKYIADEYNSQIKRNLFPDFFGKFAKGSTWLKLGGVALVGALAQWFLASRS